MNLLYLSLLGIGDGVNFSGAPVRVFSPLLAAGLAAFAAWLAKLLITARRALAAPLPASMRGQMRFFVMYAAAATLESVAFTESRGRSGTCSPRAAFDHGLSPTKVRLFSDPAPQPAALCAPVGTFGFETECASWRWLVISLLVVACVLGARDARKQPTTRRQPPGGRSRCAQGRASAASPRQRASLRQLGGATARLRPVLVLCHLSAVSSELATNVACVPYKQNEALLDFSGAKRQRFLHCAHPPPAERARIVPVPQGRTCCTTTWAALPVTTARYLILISVTTPSDAHQRCRSSATSALLASIQSALVRHWTTCATRESVRAGPEPTRSPLGPACPSAHLARRAQSSETSSPPRVPPPWGPRPSTCTLRTPRITPIGCAPPSNMSLSRLRPPKRAPCDVALPCSHPSCSP